MVTGKFVAFGTAWRMGNTLKQNLRNMANLTETLSAHNFQYQAVLGRYEATDEQSLAVSLHSMDMAKQFARHVGVVYQQDCIGLLELDTMTFTLLYPCGKLELLGKFRPVSEDEAFRAIASTYWQGQYWIAG